MLTRLDLCLYPSLHSQHHAFPLHRSSNRNVYSSDLKHHLRVFVFVRDHPFSSGSMDTTTTCWKGFIDREMKELSSTKFPNSSTYFVPFAIRPVFFFFVFFLVTHRVTHHIIVLLFWSQIHHSCIYPSIHPSIHPSIYLSIHPP